MKTLPHGVAARKLALWNLLQGRKREYIASSVSTVTAAAWRKRPRTFAPNGPGPCPLGDRQHYFVAFRSSRSWRAFLMFFMMAASFSVTLFT